MTGYLMLKKSTFDGLTDLKQKIIRCSQWDTRLTDSPSTWQKGPVVAYGYGDTRWDEDGMSLLGAITANLNALESEVVRSGYDDEHGFVLQAVTFGLLRGKGLLTYPEDIPAVSDNRLQEILTAQSAPAGQIAFLTVAPSEDGWSVWPTPPEE